MKFVALLFVFAGLVLAGCGTLSTHRDAGLRRVKRVYVEHLLNDNLRIDEAIVSELKQLGYEASAGPMTMMPDGVDAIVTYTERSAWDFKTYLIELTVEVKASFDGKVLGTGRYYQPSMHAKSPAAAVHAVIAPIFARH